MSESLIHRVSEGDGPPLLLLNGGMMTVLSWKPISSQLGGYRRIGCDFRGQLLSPGAGHPTLEAHAADVVAVLDHLGLDSVHIVGTSFGAEVGLVLAADAPERVRSLVAITASDVTTDSMRRGVAELTSRIHGILAGEPGLDALHEYFFEEIHSRAYLDAHGPQLEERKSFFSRLPASWYRGLLGLLDCTLHIDLRPRLGRITCPTLVLGAAHDLVMPIEHSHALGAGIPGAELDVHPDAGHALILEDPDWLIERCRAFLEARSA